MAVDHKFVGTQEEGIAVLTQMKKATARARGVPYAPEPGDFILHPIGLLHVVDDPDAVDTATGEEFDQSEVDTILDDTPPESVAKRKGA